MTVTDKMSLPEIRGRKRVALTITTNSRSTKASPATKSSSSPETIIPTETQLGGEVYSDSNYHTCRPVRYEYRYSQRTWITILSCEEYCALAEYEETCITDEEEPRDDDLATEDEIINEEEIVTEDEVVDEGGIPGAHAVASAEELTLTNFPRFPELVPEIRLKIWKAICLEPRMVDVFQVRKTFDIIEHVRTFEYKSHCPIPAILHTSHEARYEGLKYYTLGFGRVARWTTDDEGFYVEELRPLQLPPRIYFNPRCDIICPIPEGMNFLQLFFLP